MSCKWAVAAAAAAAACVSCKAQCCKTHYVLQFKGLLVIENPKKYEKILEKTSQNWRFGSQHRLKFHPVSPLCDKIAFGAKIGVPCRCVLTFFDDFRCPRGSPKHPKIDKNRHQFLTFFFDASWKASWRVLGAKMVPKPLRITPKMDPKEANRALQKGKDFNRGKQWKKTTENNFLNENAAKAELWTFWFFIGFYSVICMSAFCTLG